MVAYDAEREDCCGSGELGDLEIERALSATTVLVCLQFWQLRAVFFCYCGSLRDWKVLEDTGLLFVGSDQQFHT